MGFPQLVPNIHPNNQRIILIPKSKGFSALEEGMFWKLIAPPESISIIVGAAPHGGAGMVV
jgi:hypothetical protein